MTALADLADRIRAGETGYNTVMAMALGWMETRSPHTDTAPFWVRTPDGKYSPHLPDYENNPRFAFEEIKRGWGMLADLDVDQVSVSIWGCRCNTLADICRDDLDITRAINEALIRAVSKEGGEG